MKIRLTQLDGKIPNLALMKIAHFYKSKGYEVFFKKSIHKDIFEPSYDLVYASAIFTSSAKKIKLFKNSFPDAIIGGTGSGNNTTVEKLLDAPSYENYDYSIYPDYPHSIGFSQRGCRLKCPFCVVPKKEGKNKSHNSISQIWRGEPYPKNILLLDNDFFGQTDWKIKAKEIIDGDFKVSFNQGINIRLINEEATEYLSKMKYYNHDFKTKRIYTAWDNKKDEKRFFKGIDLLLNAGIKAQHIMVYMLVGYWKNESFKEDVYHRFEKMVEKGLTPYPMVYGDNPKLKKFQRWVIRRYYQFIPFDFFLNKTAKDYYRKKEVKTQNNIF